MKKVLVTGGSGFIGERVVEAVLEKGYEARVFDLVEPSVEGMGVSYRQGSVLDPYVLSTAVKGCDCVIHMAAVLGVRHTEHNRLECMLINIQGTVNVLEACVKERVKRIIFASSSEVYGEQELQPITEDAPLNPKSNYAISKIAGEEYLRAYFETYGLKYNVVRLFNVYGEGQREEFVVPKLVKNVVNNTPPVIYGNGEQTRCFCYVKDAARGIAALLDSPAEREVFNIGNDTECISIKDLASMIIELAGSPLKPKFVSYDDSDRDSDREILKRMPCLEKARKILKYRSPTSLKEGLNRMIEFYRARAKPGKYENNIINKQ